MAIVTEFTNYANTDIPYIVANDLANQITYPDTMTITVNGKELTFKKGYTNFTIGTFDHFSSYYHNGINDQYIFDYAIKSKNNVDFKYMLFYHKRRGSSLDMGIALAKDMYLEDYSPNGGIHWGLVGMTTGEEGNSRFAILEVGEYIGIIRTWDATNAYNQYVGTGGQYIYVEKKALEFLGEYDGHTYDTEYGGISDADGYNPNFDNSSDIIPVPNMPSVGVSNVGFVNVYKTTQGALQNLGADLFPDFVPPPTPEPSTDVATALTMGLNNVVENITNFLNTYINSNIVDYIIDCHCLPVSPTIGENEQIKIGFKTFPQSAFRVTSDYVDFNCGTLSLKEYYGNFIDYVGTSASLYLPFIGFVPIKNEYFQSGELTVKYRFNIIDGSFMAYVLATSSKSNLKNTVIGTYSGNACVHIPITGTNYANMVSGLVNGATAIATAKKNVGALALNTAMSTISMKPEMQGNNTYNATSSFLGIRYPYLLIEREVSNFSELYPNEYGLPLNATKTINELSGYVEMDENIHIELNCMDEEKQMLKDLLTGGIII